MFKNKATLRNGSVLLLTFFLVIWPAQYACAGDVTFAWDPESDATVTGYKVHYGTASGTYTLSIDVGNTTSVTVSNLEAGTTYYFASTAYDASGQESGYSNEIQFTAPSAACTFYLSPAGQSIGPAAQTFYINLTTGSTCTWNAVSSGPWVTTAKASGAGSVSLIFSAAANMDASPRSATITIGDQQATVTQAGFSGYTITGSAGSNGSISPAGAIAVPSGSSKTYTISPRLGFKISRVLVDGKDVGPVTSYTFGNIGSNRTIRAEFKFRWK